MIHRYTTLFKSINLVVDYLLLNFSLIVLYNILYPSSEYWLHNKQYLPIVLVFNLIWFVAATIFKIYENVLNKDSVRTLTHVAKTFILFCGIIYVVLLELKGNSEYFISDKYAGFSFVLFGILLIAWKLVFLILRKSRRAKLKDGRTAVIVGAGHSGTKLYSHFKKGYFREYEVHGFFEDDPSKVKLPQLYLGSVANCLDYVRKNKVDEIFCALPYSESNTIKSLMTEADKYLIRFKIIPEYSEYFKKSAVVQNYGNIPVISVRPEPLDNKLNQLIKRGFDIFLSVFTILLIFTWLFPILALIIKLESKGPVFFVQRRSGRNNKSFYCLKFRSMHLNKDSDTLQAMKGDSRITKVGAFLRKTSMDELPQFFNVLIGNMSTVGPRPHMVKHTRMYSKLIDSFMVRHFLKPGITGWAQVNGFRGQTTTTKAMLKRIEADVWYLENWSFLLDLKIIFLTFITAIKGDKNAF